MDRADASFEKAFPYELIPTNIAGAYSVPAPPDDFDPNTASAAALIKHGLHWRRPKPGDPPALVAAWKKVFSRRWLAKDRVVPVMETVSGKTHPLRRPAGVPNNGNVPGWAGCVLGGIAGSWSGAMAMWNVPTVSVPNQPQGNYPGWDSSSWVGIGGGPDTDGVYYSTDVLQTGIQQYVPPGGKPQYTPWYEWWVPVPQNLPAGTLVDQQGYPLAWPQYVNQTNILNFIVEAGDEIIATVLYHGNVGGGISLANNRTGQQVLVNLKPPPTASFNGSSTEWIMESPGSGWPVTSLPNFTPVAFGNAFAVYPECSLAGLPQASGITDIFTPAGQMTKTSVGDVSVTVTYIGG